MDIKLSIIDICYTIKAPISKTLMLFLFMNEFFLKGESWNIDRNAEERCPPYRYIFFRAL